MVRGAKISLLGCGWLGKPLAIKLVQKGYSVLGSTTSSPKIQELKQAGIEAYQLKAQSTLIGGLGFRRLFEVDSLILNIPPNSPEAYCSQISLLLKAAEQGTVGQIIFASSVGVYGPASGLISEQSPTAPNRAARKAVLEAEKLVAQSPIKSIILRFAGLVGGGRQAGRFLAGKKNLKGADIPVNLVHLGDCIAVVERLLEGNYWGAIYNVCSGEHPSRKAFYTKAALRLGLEPPTFVKEISPATKRIISNEKLVTQLDYQFQFPIDA